MMLSGDVTMQKTPILESASQLRNNAASAKPRTNVLEFPMQVKRKKEPKHASCVGPDSYVHNSQAGYEGKFFHLAFVLFSTVYVFPGLHIFVF